MGWNISKASVLPPAGERRLSRRRSGCIRIACYGEDAFPLQLTSRQENLLGMYAWHLHPAVHRGSQDLVRSPQQGYWRQIVHVHQLQNLAERESLQ